MFVALVGGSSWTGCPSSTMSFLCRSVKARLRRKIALFCNRAAQSMTIYCRECEWTRERFDTSILSAINLRTKANMIDSMCCETRSTIINVKMWGEICFFLESFQGAYGSISIWRGWKRARAISNSSHLCVGAVQIISTSLLRTNYYIIARKYGALA